MGYRACLLSLKTFEVVLVGDSHKASSARLATGDRN